jgi:arylsulfatase A-like enzyme
MSVLNRRQFCTAAGVSALAGSAAGAGKLPNIVFILADDLGWGDLRCYNPESRIPTPNADRLAREGMRFTDMHSPSAVCTPTRYGILTGRYCWRTHLKSGVLWGYSPNLIESGRMTVASMLKSRGYFTAGVGKWHLGLGDREKADYSRPLHPCPIDHGFDYYYGIPASLDMEPYLYFENDRAVEQPTSHTEGSDTPRGVFWRPGPIAPRFQMEEVLPNLTAKAESVIRERGKKPDAPFFLYFPLSGPHTPWVPTRQFRGRSKAGDYGDFVSQVDDTVGRIMRALDDAKLSSNTLLIFTSDNGAHWTPEDRAKFPHRANAGWRGMKADIWDAGHRIPFLARWPEKVRAGSVSSQLGCLTDLLATAANITGTKLPDNAGEDSFSLSATLTGEGQKPARNAVVHHSADGMFAIREGDWKLALGLGSGGFSEPRRVSDGTGRAEGQLYNLAKDPSEAENIYARHPEVVARLSALLELYRKQGRSR